LGGEASFGLLSHRAEPGLVIRILHGLCGAWTSRAGFNAFRAEEGRGNTPDSRGDVWSIAFALNELLLEVRLLMVGEIMNLELLTW